MSNGSRARLFLVLLVGVLATAVAARAFLSPRPSTAEAPRPNAPAPAPPAVDARTRDEWKRAFDGKESPGDRELLLRDAAKAGTPDAVRFVGETASSGDRLQTVAAEALGRVTQPSARPELLKLARSPSILPAANAVRALANIASPEDLPLFRELAEKGDPPRLRQEGVRGLGKLRRPEASAALQELLAKASDEQARLGVLAALRESGRADARAALEQFLARADLTATEKGLAQSALQASTGR